MEAAYNKKSLGDVRRDFLPTLGVEARVNEYYNLIQKKISKLPKQQHIRQPDGKLRPFLNQFENTAEGSKGEMVPPKAFVDAAVAEVYAMVRTEYPIIQESIIEGLNKLLPQLPQYVSQELNS
jgi:hypothetical protein